MNRFLAISGVAAVLGLGACKEKGPAIEMGNRSIEDSTYVTTSVPAAQKHYILAEEFTGATCTNCPDARDMLHDISAANDHRIIVMGIHCFGIGQATPVHDAKYDFRTEEGTSIKNTYYGDLQGIPSAGFDRVKVGNISALLTPKWANAINERLAKNTPVNIEMTSSYDESIHKASAEVKITFTQATAGKFKLSLVLVEDSLIDAQEFPSSEVQHDYVFMHTFRDYISDILSNVPNVEAGRTFIRRFKNFDMKIPGGSEQKEGWKAKNCKLIAFVHNDTEVLQAAEVHLGE
jgi:hypothetical protein